MDTTSAHHWPWDAPDNADELDVRRAYARLLKQQRPDEEEREAFQRLRYAYESALQMATRGGGGVAATIAAVSASVPVAAVGTQPAT